MWTDKLYATRYPFKICKMTKKIAEIEIKILKLWENIIWF